MNQNANSILTLPEINIETIFGSGKLTDFVGNNLVIFFYPKDNTPGWSLFENSLPISGKDFDVSIFDK